MHTCHPHWNRKFREISTKTTWKQHTFLFRFEQQTWMHLDVASLRRSTNTCVPGREMSQKVITSTESNRYLMSRQSIRISWLKNTRKWQDILRESSRFFSINFASSAGETCDVTPRIPCLVPTVPSRDKFLLSFPAIFQCSAPFWSVLRSFGLRQNLVENGSGSNRAAQLWDWNMQKRKKNCWSSFMDKLRQTNIAVRWQGETEKKLASFWNWFCNTSVQKIT